MTFLDTIKNKINNAQIISFDIFDTLLLRPYVVPESLWEHIGILNKIDNFRNLRLWAFQDARKKYCINGVEEITLEQIYEFMPEEYRYLKEKEIELETSVLQQNKEIKEVVDYAISTGKKVIAISDMYLPVDLLRSILDRNGYSNINEIYVSSETKLLKATGALYKYVLKNLGVKADKVLHIGDNMRSDIDAAKKIGISAVFYSKIIDKYFAMNYRAKDFYNKNKRFFYPSILLGSIALFLHNNGLLKEDLSDEEYWYKLGVEYSAPLAFTFSKWLNVKFKEDGIEEALFIARDGFILQKVFDLINPDLKTHYVYAPRIIALAGTLDLSRKFEFNDFEGISGVNALKDYYAEKYPEKVIDKNKEKIEIKNRKDAYQYYLSHKKKWENYSKQEIEDYKHYLESLDISGSKIALVDMMTTFFTAQLFLSKSLENKSLCGYYYWISRIFDDRYGRQLHFENFNNNWYYIPFVELLITSPEMPVKSLSGNKPVYKTNNAEPEKIRSFATSFISKGAVEFSEGLINMFGNIDIPLDSVRLNDWINRFRFNPTDMDKKMFAKLAHAWEINHKEYTPIFPDWANVANIQKENSSPALPTIPQKLFSVRNEYNHKVVRCLGLKFKFRRNYKKENKMKLYSEKIYDNKKRIRVLGVTVYKKENKPDFVERKYLGGLIKSKKNERQCKLYFLGIQIYKKDKKFDLYKLQRSIDAIEKRTAVLQDFENRVIRRLTQVNQRLISASVLHQKTFAKWKAAFRGKTVVLVGAGPTVNYFEPVEGAVYVGCNRAFMFDKVDFDILFSIDKAGIDRWYDEFFEYRKDKCIKFIGDQNLGVNFQIPENKIPLENVYRYITYAGIDFVSRFNLDIATSPLHNAASVSLQALQFILYTQPEKIYIVGIDCTGASKTYFKTDGNEYNNAKRGEDAARLDRNNVNFYKQIKQFAETYYPDTEIISVNPVGLKGIFKDVYTNSYLEQNPDLRQNLGEDICILNECANGDDYLLSV